jgi:MoaA/NifB/PqqE/SkfB family radical SAM enzyme
MNMQNVNDNFAQKKVIIEPEWMEILLNTTTKCNINSCLTCPHKYRDYGSHMPRAIFERISPYLKNMHKIYLHGFGEPFANPDFMYFLKQAKHQNPNIFTSVFTNGTLLEKFADELVKNGLDEILISLDASNKDLYKEIRQADFEKVIAGIRKLRSLSPKIIIKITMVLNQKNIYDLFDFVELAKDVKANEVGLMNMYTGLEDLPEDVKKLSLLADKNWTKTAISIIKEAKKRCNDYNISISIPLCFVDLPRNEEHSNPSSSGQQRIFCNHPFGFFMQIAVDGSILPCCGGYNGVPLGNALKQDLSEIWNGPLYQELRKCIIENRVFEGGCKTCEQYKVG